MPIIEPKIFLPPRPKRTLLSAGPPSKKRKTVHKIEEINFDNDARADYLTGFHKRKVARATKAREEAEKKEKEERVNLPFYWTSKVGMNADIWGGLVARGEETGVGGTC
ncbi:Ribosomal RNA-processing protein [Lachnellula subtilissima]|uniref:Ribosomal RNA-processing protein n=1 Tax=Lachnellula subtilissima TaxID=602034 RepID=A0A8H8UBT7_9HELO|nr:Ribosomal RNA-processing protein [Lachnellula subtilissima]